MLTLPPPPVETWPQRALHAGRGLLMGCADLIPGISGGTVALIVGIYSRLIGFISHASTVPVQAIRGQHIAAWQRFKALDWSLVLPVGAGIASALVLGSHFIPTLLERYPVECRGFFMGLVAGSLIVPWREVGTVTARTYGVLALAALAAFFLTGLPALADTSNPGPLRIFFSASIAINAMILPGISGAFLLEVLGIYKTSLESIKAFDLVYILIFGAGAAFGLGSFARVLSWLLTYRHALTMTVMTGLMVGSLRALWPWQGTDASGEFTPSLLLAPPGDGSVWLIVGLIALGFGVVTAIDQGARRLLRPSDG